MELMTILNRCHRFRVFVYQHAHFSADKKSFEVAVRPRKGSAAVCSRCHLPAPGYDQLAERRFEFIPRGARLPSVHHAAGQPSPLRHFRAQKLLSSGVAEGLNNKAKVTMRESCGFRTFRCLALALYHSLGKLPEPESTHEFF